LKISYFGVDLESVFRFDIDEFAFHLAVNDCIGKSAFASSERDFQQGFVNVIVVVVVVVVVVQVVVVQVVVVQVVVVQVVVVQVVVVVG
jgi:hypothetical protein